LGFPLKHGTKSPRGNACLHSAVKKAAALLCSFGVALMFIDEMTEALFSGGIMCLVIGHKTYPDRLLI